MPDNINLDVSQVLNLFASVRVADPAAAQRALDVLRLILNRETLTPGEVAEALKPLTSRIDTMIGSQQQILNRIGELMATQEQITSALSRVEAGTTKAATAVTAIGTRITGLEDAIKNAGLTTEQETALLAQLDGVGTSVETLASALEAMGKTPETPVPVPPPDPLPPIE